MTASKRLSETNMARPSLLRHIYPYYLVIVLAPFLVVLWYARSAIHDFYIGQIADKLRCEAMVVLYEVERLPFPWKSDTADEVCDRLGKDASSRITLIDASGQVVGDSQEDLSLMDNHRDRPEVASALKGRSDRVIRYSASLKRQMIYYAYPVRRDGKVVGAVRLSMPLSEVEDALQGLYERMTIAASLAILLAILSGFVVSRMVARPTDEMRHGAERFAKGDLDYRLAIPEAREMAELAEAINSMAAQLRERIDAINRQRGELEAVLSSMVEGVVAVDNDELVLRMNETAARLLGVDAGAAIGRPLQDAVSNLRLWDLVSKTLSSKAPVAGDIVVEGREDRNLEAHVTPLRNQDGRMAGVLIVLNDVTRNRRLEQVQKDFVENVSHELRTPVTSIKGFVETLTDGAARNPQDLERFLGIIAKQADRLNSIVDDILSLSMIEHDAERNTLDFNKERIIEILNDAIEVCDHRAKQKNIRLRLKCPDDLAAKVNAALIEQAVVNLIDNAVKYSPEGTAVDIQAAMSGRTIVVSVKDEGCGIPEPHQARIFERFYRVDKGRSRQLGGTGLGLAIVKHIALVHNGSVGVDSTPGEGSTFSIQIPARE
jgi:two-component system phosphate regulon sensor histidine kinase PhoR